MNQGCFRACLSVGRFVGEMFNSDKIKSFASVERKENVLGNYSLVKNLTFVGEVRDSEVI